MSHEAEVIALALTFIVHVLGAAVLIWAMFDADNRPDWRSIWPRDDDGGGGGGRGDEPGPEPDPSGDGVPLLPDARPADVRLRGPRRLRDERPRPRRRPGHDPEPVRTPQRSAD